MNKEQEKTEKKEERKICPFNSKLECKNCRLFQVYPGSGGERVCVFVRMAE